MSDPFAGKVPGKKWQFTPVPLPVNEDRGIEMAAQGGSKESDMTERLHSEQVTRKQDGKEVPKGTHYPNPHFLIRFTTLRYSGV